MSTRPYGDPEDNALRAFHEQKNVKDVLKALNAFSEQNPDWTFGEIVGAVCGLANPRSVSNDFFVKWLAANASRYQEKESSP